LSYTRSAARPDEIAALDNGSVVQGGDAYYAYVSCVRPAAS